MRESQFWTLMEDEFGSANAGIIASSLELPGLKGTAQTALATGIAPRDVWAAVCDLHEIPTARRLGRDIEPRDTGAA
ncbi:hypothetical protein GCM10009720_17340 [Yaniella flava]|uniref:DUF3046 domain-containing protein n=1 Tax=Yaniella flava TaxID=287930 RepID=A0ABN2UHZ4_9MICC|nr:DUF3046 domain-containing protein [Micrococcaceae bacterium]